ncbi:MAG: fibronectin type III domain-containing protein, partial [Gammaproteobacteria bacterium]
WRNPGLRLPAEWTSLEVENPSGHYQLSHEDNGIEPGVRYEVQVRGFVNNAWQDWSPSGIARSSTHDDLAPRLRWMAVSEANGDLRMTEPAVSSEVFAYSVYIPSAITLANFAVQPKTRATKIVVTTPGNTVTAVNGKAKVPLAAGEQTVNLELTSQLGGLATYTLTIKRDRLRAVELVAAEVNAETLSPTDIIPGDTLALRPAFAPDVRSYDLSVSHHVPKLRLRLAADSTAVRSIAYFNELDANSKLFPDDYPAPLAGRLADLDDSAIMDYPLAVGKTQLVIRLHGANGSEIDQYHIYIYRAAQLFLPDMPQTVTAEAGVAKIHVAWTAPRNLHGDAGLERSGYHLRWRYVLDEQAQDYGRWQDAAGDRTSGELLAATATSHTIAGRLYFLPYEMQIAAANASGIGAWVAVKITAVQVPAPDAIYELITNDEGGDAQLRVELPLKRTHTKTGFVNFNPDTIADYGVQIKSADADWPELQLSGAHHLPPGITRTSTEKESERGVFHFSGLVSGQSYDVRAFYTHHDLVNNRPTAGPFSPSTRINTAAPKVSPIVRLLSSDAALTVEWSMPNNAPATGYLVRWNHAYATSWDWRDPGTRHYYLEPQAVDASESSYRISGLQNKQPYLVQVAALNEFGAGPWSEAAQGEPGALAIPADIIATGADRAIVLTWTAPPMVADDSLNGYRVRWAKRALPNAQPDAQPNPWLRVASGGGGVLGKFVRHDQTTYTIPNLENGIEYLLQLAAFNS